MRRDYEAGDQGRSMPHAWLSPASRRGPRRHSATTLTLGGLAVLMAVVLVGGSLFVYDKYRTVMDGIKRVNVSGDLQGKRPPADPNALNLLVIGSDSRAGRNAKAGGHVANSGQRSDTIMVVHIAPGAHQVAVLSFPRDSVVPILGCTAENGATGQTAQPASEVEQINSSFAYGGPGCLWKTIEQTTGIHINDFVELTFVGFERVIDTLGGVQVCLPETVNDPVSHLHLKAGRHHIWGKQALAFWRTREGLGLGDDPQRIQRDQFLMASLVQGIEHSSLLKSPSTMLRVIDTLTGHGFVTTDSGLGAQRMLQLGEDLRGISTEHVQFVTVPWNTYTGNAEWIDSSESPTVGNANWVQWVQPQANELFGSVAHDTKLPKTPKIKVKHVPAASVAVKVLNGSLKTGIGAATATKLADRGFNVVGAAGNAATQTYADTVIEYRDTAQVPAAQTLEALFTNVRLQLDPHMKGSAVRLILGSTFTGLKTAKSKSGISKLAQTYGGITGNTNICHDSAAFAGPGGG